MNTLIVVGVSGVSGVACLVVAVVVYVHQPRMVSGMTNADMVTLSYQKILKVLSLPIAGHPLHVQHPSRLGGMRCGLNKVSLIQAVDLSTFIMRHYIDILIGGNSTIPRRPILLKNEKK